MGIDLSNKYPAGVMPRNNDMLTGELLRALARDPQLQEIFKQNAGSIGTKKYSDLGDLSSIDSGNFDPSTMPGNGEVLNTDPNNQDNTNYLQDVPSTSDSGWGNQSMNFTDAPPSFWEKALGSLFSGGGGSALSLLNYYLSNKDAKSAQERANNLQAASQLLAFPPELVNLRSGYFNDMNNLRPNVFGTGVTPGALFSDQQTINTSPTTSNEPTGGGTPKMDATRRLPSVDEAIAAQNNPQNSFLGNLTQAATVYRDPRINQNIDSIYGMYGQIQPQEQQNLLSLINNLGGIQGQSQQDLAGLLNQASMGYNGIANAQAGGQEVNQKLLNLGMGYAQGQQNLGGFDQFIGATGNALQGANNLSNGIDQQTQDLIKANETQSRIEEDRAIQELNDQLSARGLANSQAGIEAIANAKAQFSRQRNQDQAQLKQNALNTAFQQQLQARGLQGQLAGQGGSILSQQGQLGNADLNARLRALETSGGQQSRGIADLLGLYGAGQQGIGQMNALSNQRNQQAMNFANQNYGLQNAYLNQPIDAQLRQTQLLQNNEARNQAMGNQAFSNSNVLFQNIANLMSQGANMGQSAALQNGAQQAQLARDMNQIAQANRQNAGQSLGNAVNFGSEWYKNNQQNGYYP